MDLFMALARLLWWLISVSAVLAVVVGMGWVVALCCPLSLFQASVLFVATAFLVSYMKAHKKTHKLFWSDDGVFHETSGDDD